MLANGFAPKSPMSERPEFRAPENGALGTPMFAVQISSENSDGGVEGHRGGRWLIMGSQIFVPFLSLEMPCTGHIRARIFGQLQDMNANQIQLGGSYDF